MLLHPNVVNNLTVLAKSMSKIDLCDELGHETFSKLLVRHSELCPASINYYRRVTEFKTKSLADFVAKFENLNPKLVARAKFQNQCEKILRADFSNVEQSWISY